MPQEKKQKKSLLNRIKELYQYFIGNKQSNSLRTHLTRGAIGSFIMKISSTALTFLISVILARILGAEEFGYYAYAMAIVGLLAVPTKLGLPQLIVRQVAAYKTKEQWGLMRGLLVRTNQAVLLISLFLIIITVFAAWQLSNYIPSLSFSVFCIALLMLPLMGLGALRGATLRGLNHVLLGQLPENIIRQGTFILLIILFVFIFNNSINDSSLAMLLQVTATLVAFIVGAILLFKYLPQSTKTTTSEYDTQAWIRSAVPLLIAGGMNIVNKRTDILMLGVFTNSEAVGVYQVVTRGAELIVFSLMAVNMAVAPVFSQFYASNEMKKLQRVVSISSWGILLFSLPLALLLIIFGPWILLNVFGTEFVIGANALAILSIGQLLNASMGSVALLLNMTGYERDSAKGVTIAAVINIILNILLIPKWGIEGAATATTVSFVVWNLLLAICVYKRLHIYPGILGKI